MLQKKTTGVNMTREMRIMELLETKFDSINYKKYKMPHLHNEDLNVKIDLQEQKITARKILAMGDDNLEILVMSFGTVQSSPIKDKYRYSSDDENYWTPYKLRAQMTLNKYNLDVQEASVSTKTQLNASNPNATLNHSIDYDSDYHVWVDTYGGFTPVTRDLQRESKNRYANSRKMMELSHCIQLQQAVVYRAYHLVFEIDGLKTHFFGDQ